MSLNISPQSNVPYDDTGVFKKEPTDPSNNLSLFIKAVFKNSLESNITKPEEKELLLKDLRSIESTLEMTNTGIENPEEIIQQVKEIISCLENNKSYSEKLWEKNEIQLNEGTLIFSASLKDILDDTSFETLIQSMSEEHQRQVIDCRFDGLPLQEKSVETLLKYCPNMSEEALERIAPSWKESDLSRLTKMWPLFSEVPLKERPSVVTGFLKCFGKQDSTAIKEAIIRTIIAIDSKDRENVAKWASKCFHEGIDGYGKASIIGAIAKIPFENRENVVALSLNCFHEGTTGYEKTSIIGAISKIPFEDRENVVEWSLKYFHEGITQYEQVAIIETIASIPLKDRENVTQLASKCFHDGIDGYEKVGIINTIAKIPFEDRENAIEWASECFQKGATKDNKGEIIKIIASVSSKDRENVVEWSLKCLHEAISGFEKTEIIKIIASISSEERENVVEWTLKCSSEKTPIDGTLELIKTITEIPSARRENTITCALKCFHDDMPGYEKIQLLNTIAEIFSEDQEHVVTCSLKCFHDGISTNERIQILEFVTKIPSENREDITACALRYFHKGVPGYDNMRMLEALFIASISPEDREDVIAYALKCFDENSTGDEKIEILEAISIIPKEERSFIDEPFIQKFLENHGLDKDDLLNAYLLPVTIRSEEALLNPKQHNQELITSLEQKLSNETLPKKTLIGLAEYADEIYGEKLPEEHPLIQRVIELLAVNAIEGPKNPFTLFRKLKALRNTPVDFQTPVGETVPLRINMTRLKEMAMASTIKREDLPEKATKEAWESVLNAFKNKVEMHLEAAEQALGQLDTTWANMEGPLFKDPQNYLTGLFDLTGKVSESEAKLKAVFNNILSKNNTPRDAQFFTEQEEVFIKTIMSIQNCKGGKQEGIAGAYQLLDAPYKYKLQLSPPMSVEERSDLQKKEGATQVLSDFIRSTAVITEEELMQYFETDTLKHAGLFTALFGAGSAEQYFEEDDDFVYHLNEAGAQVALSHIHDVEKNNLIDYIADIVRTVMERKISEDTFTEKLAEEKTSQGVHNSIYLKNAIGHLIGITNELSFDRYTTNLSTTLLEKSPEELLKLFFNEVTPEVLVSELVRAGLPDIYMKLFSNEEQLTEEGAKKLLEQTGYLIS